MFKAYFKKLGVLLSTKEKRKLVILLFMMIIGSMLEVAGIGILPVFIAIVAKPQLLEKYTLIHNVLVNLGIVSSSDLLISGSIAIILVFILKNIFITFLNYTKAKVIYHIQLRMSYDLFSRYLSAPYTFHLKRNSSELLSNVYDSVKIVIGGVMLPLMSIIMEFLLILLTIGLLLSIETAITLSTIIIFTATGLIYLKVTKKKSMSFGQELNVLRTIVYKVVYESFGGTKEIKVLNRDRFYVNQFYKSSKRNAEALTHQAYINGLSKPILETIAITTILVIAIFLEKKNDNVESILPILALFGFASVRLMPSINQIIGGFSSIRYSLPAIDPVYNDLQALTKEYASRITEEKASLQINFENEIRFEKVSYTYPEAETPSLKNVDLRISKGKAVAFVGASGAGKTTIVDLLLGLLKPASGKILIDQNDLQLNISSWQKKIGYIPQHIFLADNTIRNNIALGVEEKEIDDTKVWNAIKLAQLETLVNELPSGIQTEIGEKGVRLSGGQRQRIGIARALYHNPEVLIMDEATSALDNLTEKYIVEEIERLKGIRTVIIIAHRLTTVQNCDSIYYMEKGELKDSGTFNELLEKNLSFKKLALIQH